MLAFMVEESVCTMVYLFNSFFVLSCFFFFWAAAVKGSMTYAFTHIGDFLLLLLHHILPSPLKSQSQGLNSSLEAKIPVSRLGFGPQAWDLGLETEIWASRLGFEGEGQRRRRRRRRRRKSSICVKA